MTAALRRRLEAAERADRGRIYAWHVISDERLTALLGLMNRCRTMDDLEVLLGDHPDLAAALDKLWAASGDGAAAAAGRRLARQLRREPQATGPPLLEA